MDLDLSEKQKEYSKQQSQQHRKKHISYYKNYSKAYYQKNKDKFRQYYQKYKMKKIQILNGSFIEQDTYKKPKKTQQQKIADRHAKIQKEYEIRRAKWIAENQHLFTTHEE